jgi:hypothetical protein
MQTNGMELALMCWAILIALIGVDYHRSERDE